MTREELQALVDGPHGASRQAGAALKSNGAAGRRKDARPQGYAAPPSSGPEGETCGSCRHLARVHHAKTYLKCGLNRHLWTGGSKTDVRARSAACRLWETLE